MSAIDELMAKEDMTKLERVVHLVYGWDESLCWLAEDAAAELAALRRVAEAARNHDLMAGPPSNRDGECYFCGGGVMHAEYCDYHKWRTELNAALAEYDKCRAA